MSSRYRPPAGMPSAPKNSEKNLENTNALWRILEWFSDLPPEVADRLRLFHSELLRFNAKVNLISRNTERDADESHFADCILAAKILAGQNMDARVFDIGSGNGLPGIVLAIMDPSREFVLVESDGRKCEFLKHMIQVLGLKNASVMNVRVETLVGQGVTCGVSRGFASISKAVLSCNRVFDKGGRFFHLKGSNWSTEVAEIPSQLISMWAPHLAGGYTLPISQARRAIVVTQKKF